MVTARVRARAGAVVLVAVLGLSACSVSWTTGGVARPQGALPVAQAGARTPPTAGLARFYDQTVAWTSCSGGFQCGRVVVPLSYADPGGATVSLAVARLPARDPAQRLGALLVNPGGPGASGVDFAQEAAGQFAPAVLARYDLVGWDPRGVQRSDPVHCLSAAATDQLLAAPGDPSTPVGEQALLAMDASFARACQARSGPLLPHVGTVDTARDLDVLRGVLGDARLAYYGASYGTFIGATYAEMFPHRVGRMVLDGALDPALSAAGEAAGQTAGFAGELNAFLADCLTRSGCPVGPTVAAANAQLLALSAQAAVHPLATQSGRPLTQSELLTGVILPLYDPQGWPVLRQALASGLKGDGTQLLELADAYNSRNPNGTYSTNTNDANYAINCEDRPDHSTLAQTAALAGRLAAVSPLIGGYVAWGDLACTVWPVPASDHPHPIHAAGAAPILVVGTTGDPATPYAWAVALAHELDSGRLLTRVGEGHTGYHMGNTCVDNAVDTYLLAGVLPPLGTVCR